MSQKFREKIGIAVGEASVCWSELPSGVFNTEAAIKIVNDVYNEHQEIISDLESRLQIATEALEWYANENHIEWQPCANKEMSAKSLKSVECGTTAIEALEKIKGK